MDSITVIIPAQPYEHSKYFIGERNTEQNCYLKQALIDAGYSDVTVGSYGRTTINGSVFEPAQPFMYSIVKETLNKGESLSVTLVPVE